MHYDFLLRIVIYIFWHVTQGRKQLIVQLRQQIVNVSLLKTVKTFKETFPLILFLLLCTDLVVSPVPLFLRYICTQNNYYSLCH